MEVARPRTLHMGCRRVNGSAVGALLVAMAWTAGIGGCAGTPKDPLATLGDNSASTESRLRSLEMLDATPEDPASIATMRRLLFEFGVVQPVRLACFNRLYARDREKLLELIDLNLPSTTALEWRRGICERIAELQWREATPALVRSLARPMKGWMQDIRERPEYVAIEQMWGANRVGGVVFDLLVTANPSTQANLRARCWELMFELHQEDRLAELLSGLPSNSSDGLLRDLRRGWVELGVLPRTREEVLWMRTLEDESHTGFWKRAREAMASVPPEVRRTMLMKDLGVVVAAAQVRPELLPLTRNEIVEQLRSRREADGSRLYSPDFRGYGEGHSERLREHAKDLTWGDAAAMLLMLDALQDEAFVSHLFDMAQRDHADRSTEHGGVVALDASGRLSMEEFLPTHRGSDIQFHASQAMFDAAYQGVGHFHFHATQLENGRNAGPHIGDFTYADSTGVNGFVFTFIDSRRLNADWYRRGHIAVDLGTVEQP